MRILLSAYACEPGKGSEPGVGWGWAHTLAGLGHEVWALTRANNRPAIEAELAERPLPGFHPVYHDLPGWAQAGKRAGGGVGLRAYYTAWQATAVPLVRRLLAERPYDLLHHVTFAQCWSASALAGLPRPFLWGPVGGGEACPPAFWPDLGARAAVYEAARAGLRPAAGALPHLRLTARSCRLAVAATPETAAILARLGARRVIVASQVALEPETIERLGVVVRPPEPPFRLVLLGDLLPHKGGHLALAAVARLRGDWWLDVIGEGGERSRLQGLAARLGIAGRVRFHGALPRAEALERIGQAHAMLFPALHDSGGLAVAEALAAGVPVVCLGLGGPAGLVPADGGVVVPASNPRAAVEGLADAVQRLIDEPHRLAALSAGARAHACRTFGWPARASVVYAALAEAS